MTTKNFKLIARYSCGYILKEDYDTKEEAEAQAWALLNLNRFVIKVDIMEEITKL